MSARTVGERTIKLTHLDRVLFPRDGLTKGDVVDYYERVASFMVAHLQDRPLTLQRFPRGIDHSGFFQKSTPAYFPEWIPRATVEKEGGTQQAIICSEAATLVYLANQGAITLHAWLSRADRPRSPDTIMLDLDPADDDFDTVRDAALLARDLLRELNLVPYVKTTGSRGLHVAAALQRGPDNDAVKAVAEAVAARMAERAPDRFTTEFSRAKRKGRLFVDTMRNTYAQTAVPPFTVRARDGAPVAVPLHWREVEKGSVGPRSFTIANIGERLQKVGDPWAGMDLSARPLPSL